MGPAHDGKGGVSHKIQQLLNTLRRPRKNRRPIEEYYLDEDDAGTHPLTLTPSHPHTLTLCLKKRFKLTTLFFGYYFYTALSGVLCSFFFTPASQNDPSAPRPVGPMMQPAVGVPLESRQDWHRNLEAAIQHHSSTLAKQPAISVVDPHGKVYVAATYSEGITE